MTTVGIIGASGFTGAELLRLCAQHPDLDVRVATGDSQAGTRVCELYPSLAAAYPRLVLEKYDIDRCEGLDLVFLGLPHGASQAVVPELTGRVGRVVDLAADFRLRDPALYPAWYGEEHTHPELLGSFAYGLPELFRDDIAGAERVAAPGCYVTTAVLALAPLLRAGLVEPTGIVVDAASGVSGAGRPPKPTTAFCTVDENLTAYGLLDHRHTPEIEQGLGDVAGTEVQVLFTPHLAPMNRGILATCYARRASSGGPATTGDLHDLLRSTWADEPFVVVTDGSPSTKATLGSNTVHLTAVADERTGWVVAIAALDNLVKGASGQAVQCANILLGLPETTGLPVVGTWP
ncbi:MAG TPA: N-acetyl-gamma-glutamyl-phosphate reductase [Acidimicrobiales bacterium]|nr:N-acetyl-gamma-glutamyl-phosphate reductase [Acidimicrobiales bacterium]